MEINLVVFSDIHSNHVAFQRCLEEIKHREIDQCLFLGDYFSDCPYPKKTFELIKSCTNQFLCHFVKGNREDYFLDYLTSGKNDWKYGSSSGNLLATLEQFDEEIYSWIQQLPLTHFLKLDGLPSLVLAHGSLRDNKELLLSNQANTKEVLEDLPADLLLVGHTHLQTKMIWKNKTMINPGSVGIPWGYDGKTQFAILHGRDGKWHTEFLQLDYDRQLIIDEFDRSQFNFKTKIWGQCTQEAILTGVDRTTEVFKLAKQLCAVKTGKEIGLNIEESYWQEAYDLVKQTEID